MKGKISALAAIILATTFTGYAAEQLAFEDARRGRSRSMPRQPHGDVWPVGVSVGSYLVGCFKDYKDPGHLVGKGWMELKFDRMVLPADTVISVAAKVVDVPKFNVDKLGRIHGKGHPVRHPVRDIVE